MSIASWKREFYGPMKEAVKSDIAALEHAIKKWTGLLPENLEKHELNIFWAELQEEKGSFGFGIDYWTCSLCRIYLKDTDECKECPIRKVRSGKSCCDSSPKTGMSPYSYLLEKQNPRPMLRLLKRALEKVKHEKRS